MSSFVIKLDEVIDDRTSFESFKNARPGQPLIVRADDVRRITAAGIRRWLELLSYLRVRDIQVWMEGLSPPMIRCTNQIAGFLGHGILRSLYLPFFCRSCGRESEKLQSLDEIDPGSHEVPSIRCSFCEGRAEFDEIHSDFMKFYKDLNPMMPKRKKLPSEMTPDEIDAA